LYVVVLGFRKSGFAGLAASGAKALAEKKGFIAGLKRCATQIRLFQEIVKARALRTEMPES
jgi:hypothetical protein